MDKKDAAEEYSAELEWIKFREDTLGAAAFPETESKFARKFKSNPFVPIGKFHLFSNP